MGGPQKKWLSCQGDPHRAIFMRLTKKKELQKCLTSDFKPNFVFFFSRHGMGDFDLYHSEVQTLSWDPTYVPEVGLKGLTWNSISIGWTGPPEKFDPYIQYYKLNRKTDDQEVCHRTN